MLLACSHLVIAAANVPRMTRFFSGLFGVEPHYESPQFVDFVLPSRFRVAFFEPVGSAARYFRAEAERGSVSFGVTTNAIDALYARAISPEFAAQGATVSGPPKEHPWGEKSFLLLDPEGNRWEITESPSENGMLVNRE